MRNSLHKKSGGRIFTKYIALSDFKRLRLSSESWNKKTQQTVTRENEEFRSEILRYTDECEAFDCKTGMSPSFISTSNF